MAVLGFVAWVIGSVLFAAPATAHASLVETDPADGAVVDTAPAVITLTFNEPVSPNVESTTLLDAEGDPVDIDVQGSGADVRLTTSETLADGTFIVNWRVISSDDHPISGGFTFSVGEPSDTVIEVEQNEDGAGTVELALRTTNAAHYMALLGTAGLIFFTASVVPRQAWRRRVLRERFERLVLGGFVGLAVTGAVGIVLETLWTGAIPSAGVQATGLGIAGIAAAWWCHGRGRRAAMVVALIVAVGAPALSGHTRTYGQPVVTVASDVLHLVTAAIWVGGITGLLLVLATLPTADGDLAGRTVSRFSAIALGTVVTLAVTGLVMAWQIPDLTLAWPDLLYERLLVVKVAIVAFAVGAAAWNRFVLVPRLEQAAHRTDALFRIHRTLTIEAVALVVVLAVTSVLVAQVPRDMNAAEAPTSQSVSETFDGGEVTVDLTPGTLGVNALEVTVTDDRQEPLELEEPPAIDLLLEEYDIGPLEQTVTEVAPGRYAVTTEIALEGTWTIQAALRLDRFTEPVLRMEMDLS